MRGREYNLTAEADVHELLQASVASRYAGLMLLSMQHQSSASHTTPPHHTHTHTQVAGQIVKLTSTG